MGAGHLAMIRHEDHDGSVREPVVVKGLKDTAQLHINKVRAVGVELVIGQGPGLRGITLELEGIG